MARGRVLGVMLMALAVLAAAQAGDSGGDKGSGGGQPHREHHRYVVVGAGPGGLQLAYYLQRQGLDYVVLERNEVPGSFFTKYPVHRRLISTNKVATGSDDSEFNERHDWNSLLVDPGDKVQMRFKDYSSEFMPHADDMLRYLNDYELRYSINVRYRTTVTSISRTSRRKGRFVLSASRAAADGETMAWEYTADVLVLATGLFVPHKPQAYGIDVTEGYEDFDPATSLEKYRGKRVMILGTGNSAFEIANNISGVTNLVEMCSRSSPRFSWQTHYAGDVRSINAGFLDTYQLKMQNFISTCQVSENWNMARRADGTIDVNLPVSNLKELDMMQLKRRKSGERDVTQYGTYHHVIRALGFNWDRSVFNASLLPRQEQSRKYPLVTPRWESVNVPGLYFAGTMVAGRDAKRSSVFGIHGFRYAARGLSHFLAEKYEGTPWPSDRIASDAADLASSMLERAQYSASLYQMYGVMCEVYWFDNSTDDDAAPFWVHEHEVPCDHVFSAEAYQTRSFFVLTLEYDPDFGKTKDKHDVFGPEHIHHRLHPDHGYLSNFLHPVIRYFSAFKMDRTIDELHLMEYAMYRDMADQGEPVTWWNTFEGRTPAVATHHVMENVLIDFGKLEDDIEPLVRFLAGLLVTRPELLPPAVESPILRVRADPKRHPSLHPQTWINDLIQESLGEVTATMDAARQTRREAEEAADLAAEPGANGGGLDSEEGEGEGQDAGLDFDPNDMQGSYDAAQDRLKKFSGVPVVDKTNEQLGEALKHLEAIQQRHADIQNMAGQVRDMEASIRELRGNVPKNPMEEMKDEIGRMTDFVTNFDKQQGKGRGRGRGRGRAARRKPARRRATRNARSEL